MAGIIFKKVWSDSETIELEIHVSDDTSMFVNKIYTESGKLSEINKGLQYFKNDVHGGIFDIQLGAFGPEYASGAFDSRLQYDREGRGKLYIATYQQNEYESFPSNKVASEAKFYLKTEPALLDNFITQFQKMSEEKSEEAYLECLKDA
jgi:hypothetical protein